MTEPLRLCASVGWSGGVGCRQVGAALGRKALQGTEGDEEWSARARR